MQSYKVSPQQRIDGSLAKAAVKSVLLLMQSCYEAKRYRRTASTALAAKETQVLALEPAHAHGGGTLPEAQHAQYGTAAKLPTKQGLCIQTSFLSWTSFVSSAGSSTSRSKPHTIIMVSTRGNKGDAPDADEAEEAASSTAAVYTGVKATLNRRKYLDYYRLHESIDVLGGPNITVGYRLKSTRTRVGSHSLG